MGKHSGMAVTPRASDDEVDEQLERGAVRALRVQAQEHRAEAVNTLVALMRGEGEYSEDGKHYFTTPPHVRRQAARDLIELGHGKTAVQERQAAEKGGVVVHIQRLTVNQGQPPEKVIELGPVDPIGDFLSKQGVDRVLEQAEVE